MYLVFTAQCVQRSPAYLNWGGSPWSTREDYITNGRLTGIRVWYAVTPSANFLHGSVICLRKDFWPFLTLKVPSSPKQIYFV